MNKDAAWTFGDLQITMPQFGLHPDTAFSAPVIETFVRNVDPPTSVPEPSTLAVMGIGLAGAGFFRRRRKND